MEGGERKLELDGLGGGELRGCQLLRELLGLVIERRFVVDLEVSGTVLTLLDSTKPVRKDIVDSRDVSNVPGEAPNLGYLSVYLWVVKRDIIGFKALL